MMGINIRTKGQEGEREIQRILNGVVDEVRKEFGLPAHAKIDKPFQRNQNQSAVGGADLSNPFNIEIEVKRQEALSVNTWWKQCILSAARTNGIPILIYRQNRKPWNVIMNGFVQIMGGHHQPMRVAITIAAFKDWFRSYYKHHLSNN